MRMELSATIGRVSLLVLGLLTLGIPSWGADEPMKTGTFLELIAVDPASPATLKAGDKARVKIRYHCATGETVRIWVVPRTKGNHTPDSFYETSAAESKGPGEVERFVGVFAPAQVDELHASMVDAETKETLAEISYSVSLKWEGIVFGRVDPVGRPFPDLAFTSIQGEDIAVAEMKGKVVLLNFWSRFPAFHFELPHLLAAYEKHHTNGFEIVGINLDWDKAIDKAGLQTYIEDKGMPWPQYFDGKGLANNEVVKRLGLTRSHCSYFIDRQSVVRYYNTRGEQLTEAVGKLIAEDP